MWFIGVEVEQETSAPPPKKNPGSAPAKDVEAELIRFSTIRVLITKWPFSRYIERDNPYYDYYDLYNCCCCCCLYFCTEERKKK